MKKLEKLTRGAITKLLGVIPKKVIKSKKKHSKLKK